MAKSSYGKYLAELIGTFALVFIGTSVATWAGLLNVGLGAGWLAVSFAFGMTLMAVVYAIGPISGGHVNPAVTIAMAASGRMNRKDVAPYLVAQVVGAVIASAVLLLATQGIPGYSMAANGLGGNGTFALVAPNGAQAPVALATLLILEVVLTALLVFVIFSVTSRKSEHAPLAMGFALFMVHLVGVPLGSAGVNPARSLAPAVFQQGVALNNLWIFIIGPIIGGLAGWYIHKFISER
ncbi:aquaporin [Candidatus Micrarchaeota archaeon]|nr:aquaporin [Candidatus Micrarchaeota archaeon]